MPSSSSRPPVRRPALAALSRAVLALAFGGLAWWCWQRGAIVSVRDGTNLVRVDGRWWAAAVVAATVAGLMLLAAGRLAGQRPGRPAPSGVGETGQP